MDWLEISPVLVREQGSILDWSNVGWNHYKKKIVCMLEWQFLHRKHDLIAQGSGPTP